VRWKQLKMSEPTASVVLWPAKSGLPFRESRGRLGIEEAKISKTAMVGIPHDNVIENFDFQQLTSSDEVAGDFDVSFRWSWITAYAAYGISGVIPHPVLCRV
jgi:hypothetical protein